MLWEKDSKMDDRSVSRTVADLSVPAMLHGRNIRIQIYNLSSYGCMFESVEQLYENDTIQIMLVDDITARGHVIWCQKSFAGVQFIRPLHAAVIQHLGFQEPQLRVRSVGSGRSVRSKLAADLPEVHSHGSLTLLAGPVSDPLRSF